MNLSEQERDHYNWQQKTYYEAVGKFISAISLLEGYMMEILSIHFSRDKRKREDLFKYLLADTSIKVVTEIFHDIIKNEYSKFYVQNKNQLELINKFIRQRNLICHSHFYPDEDFIKKFDKTTILIRDIRRFKDSKAYIKKINLKEQTKFLEEIG
jgi:hypothetical protein